MFDGPTSHQGQAVASVSHLGRLATDATASLGAYFGERGHNPSGEHWNAISDVLVTLEAMADGVCEPSVFLSSLDPGIGKTSAVVAFAKALMASEAHTAVGMIVCVGRITEAVALAEQLAGQAASVAVLVNERDALMVMEKLPGLCEDPTKAQVLITTQQGVERKSNAMRVDDVPSFEAVESLWFNRKARSVRVWDEAYLPGVTVTVDADDLFGLVKPARKLSMDLRQELRRFADELDAAPHDAMVPVPDFESQYGITVWELVEAITGPNSKMRDDHEHTAQALFAMGGRTARVFKDNQNGATLLTYTNTLPTNLAPLLVLDASGSVRATYDFMERHRGLVRLATARKDYSPLTVNVWRCGFRRRRPLIPI